MCGRFSLNVTPESLARQFGLGELADFAPRFNIAPTQAALVVRQAVAERDGAAGRVVEAMHWGLIPSWSKDPRIGARMINARAETAAEKPAFRTALKRRRCLVPADGFYEWRAEGGGKQPYRITMGDGQPFGMAGLWEVWHGPDGDVVVSFSILTTAANALIGPLHDRMPVIVEPGAYGVWLDPEMQDTAPLEALMAPFPSERMAFQPVSTRVNSPANDDLACIAPID